MTTIPLSAVSLSSLERQYVLEALDLGMISSTGPHVRKFEDTIARKVGVRHAIATASGTSALELLLRALPVGPGDEVIVPVLTFASPALAVALVGATPVFVDVSPETWTLDPRAVKLALTPRTRVIITVDVLGHPCDYDEINKPGVPIIEDAAEAHGATYKGKPAGSFGIASVFSFHANKAISCGEGGCILSDEGDLAQRVRQLNSFGMDADRRYWHTRIGSNYRMTNLVAAVALAQLERWDSLLAGRARVAAAYDRALASLSLQRRPVAEWAGEAVWLYTVATDRRDSILAACGRQGIDARALWPALPQNPVFAKFAPRACPCADAVARRALWLPTWSEMTDESVHAVAQVITNTLLPHQTVD